MSLVLEQEQVDQVKHNLGRRPRASPTLANNSEIKQELINAKHQILLREQVNENLIQKK